METLEILVVQLILLVLVILKNNGVVKLQEVVEIYLVRIQKSAVVP